MARGSDRELCRFGPGSPDGSRDTGEPPSHSILGDRRTVRRPARSARAIRREVTGRVPPGGELVVPCRVADALLRVEREVAVGEAALEGLEAVARGDAAAEVQRQLELVGEVQHRGDDVL